MHFQERVVHGGKDFSLLSFVPGFFSSPGDLFESVRGWKVNSLMFDFIGVLVKLLIEHCHSTTPTKPQLQCFLNPCGCTVISGFISVRIKIRLKSLLVCFIHLFSRVFFCQDWTMNFCCCCTDVSLARLQMNKSHFLTSLC